MIRVRSRAALPAGGVALLVAAFIGSGTTAGCDRGCPTVEPPAATAEQQVLLAPESDAFRSVPPDTFVVRFETSKGDFLVQVIRAWAPVGAYRFYNLVRNGYYDGVRFYRVIPGFMAQFGAHGVPSIEAAWSDQPIPDDPVLVPNRRGTITYAKAGPDARTTQLFINYNDNMFLDDDRFAPFGHVIEGMDVVDRINGEYGETAPRGDGPTYACMLSGGNAYLARRFQRMDSIVTAQVVREANATAAVDTVGGA